MPASSDPARLALGLAALGWHILPLSPVSKRPLANCPACRPQHGIPAHLAHACPCLAAGGWCHGVRAATTDPARITTWWQREPRAVPGVAAGPSGLVLVDIDAHGDQLPPRLATGLLPGIDLAAEPIPRDAWDDPGRFRDGRDTLTLLARLRGGPRPLAGRPRAPAGHRRHPLRWRAPVVPGPRPQPPPGPRRPPAAGTGWPGRSTSKPDGPTASPPARPPPPAPTRYAAVTPPGPAGCPPGSPVRSSAPPPPHHDSPPPRRRYRRPAGPARPPTWPPSSAAAPSSSPPLTDGRKRALSALAYHAGGLLHWSGLPPRTRDRPAHRRRNHRRTRTPRRHPHRPPRHHQRNRPASGTARFPLMTPLCLSTLTGRKCNVSRR